MKREALIEAVVAARRETSVDGTLRSAPEWYDLDEPGRVEAFEQAFAMRQLEAALHPEGHSSTVLNVLSLIRKR